MKNTKMKQSIAALAMAAVVAVSLLGYGCGSKSASTTGAGATGDFTGTAKGFGGDVTVTLTLTDGKITGCTAEGADETEGVGSKAIEQLPLPRAAALPWTACLPQPSPPMPSRRQPLLPLPLLV